MTNETEKKFFDAFGIEAKLNGSDFNKSIQTNYPEITDRILLKLICLLVAHYWKTKEHYYLTALDEEHLHKEILNDACYVIDGMFSREKEVDFINQVRALFGECIYKEDWLNFYKAGGAANPQDYEDVYRELMEDYDE